jgi:hypothetical protein
MVKVMEGIRVLEVAQFTFVPAAEWKESGASA